MFTMELNTDNRIPLYQQIYEFIKKEIISGNIASDEKLPSKRTLAKNLGISTLTVETAYSQLNAEGFIYSLPKRGYFASEIKMTAATLTSNSEKKSAASSRRSEKKSTVNNSRPAQSQPEYTINFSDSQTDPESFPFSVWAKLLREVLNTHQNDVMKNSPAQGTLVLRQAIAKHLHQFRGMDVNPDQIVIGAGTEYLYTLLIQLFGFDKTYAIEDPCHKKITKIYNSFGVKTVHIPMDEKGILIKGLNSKKADIVHISPSHHFPTGIIMPVTRRYELLNWASEKSGRYLIEDDYDSEFRFNGKPLPTMQSIDNFDRVIYMNTFTKTLSSTIRISYMVLPQMLMEEFSRKLNFYSCTVPVMDQYTLASFIDQNYFEKHINRMRKSCGLKRDTFFAAIEKYDRKKYFSIMEGDAGLHFLLKVSQDRLEKFTDSLISKKIKLTSVAEYYNKPSAQNQNMFVINYSSIPLNKIDEIVKELTTV
ncbi:MAG: PLP-dependent aminotransferase family protein [Treponema sp.]|uniref:MocR-like pyridoxine biosynthesis transcription factor PdxR n=1 Tax=Treponema sp. TaxID=166 RepID=UPI00298E0484|nr:PLP-dependent aminotransferase family protein [Treponema sp.]MCQ2601071.1 PLP-dependent aminotransferase family protein [Treponema sp.]